MGYVAVKWALSQRTQTGNGKAVLIALASFADAKTGECFPGIDAVADQAQLSERAVYRGIQELEEIGLIQRARTGRSNRYILAVNAAKLADQNCQDGTSELPEIEKLADQNCQIGRSELPKSTSHIDEPVKEPVKEPKTPPVSPQADLVVEVWNQHGPPAGLPAVAKLTEDRRQRIGRMLREVGGLDGWKRACGMLAEAGFLTGENDRGWKADFDFLIKPGKAVKLLEGGYRRTPKRSSAVRLLDRILADEDPPMESMAWTQSKLPH